MRERQRTEPWVLEGWLESAVRVSKPGLSASLTTSETVDRSYATRYMGVSGLRD